LEIVQDQVNQFAPVIVGRLTNNLNLNIKNTYFNYPSYCWSPDQQSKSQYQKISILTTPPVIVGRLTNNLNLNVVGRATNNN